MFVSAGIKQIAKTRVKIIKVALSSAITHMTQRLNIKSTEKPHDQEGNLFVDEG